MPSRREVLKTASLALTGLAVGINNFKFSEEFKSHRPERNKRKFTSDSVDATIEHMKKVIADKELAWLFENCFPNTLDTTIEFHGKRNGKLDTFVITGDIPAMWLRDSTAQVTPYLPLCKDDRKLRDLILGVINRQTQCVLIDPTPMRSTSMTKSPRAGTKIKPPCAMNCTSASGKSIRSATPFALRISIGKPLATLRLWTAIGNRQ
jgi:hypothetical protein